MWVDETKVDDKNFRRFVYEQEKLMATMAEQSEHT